MKRISSNESMATRATVSIVVDGQRVDVPSGTSVALALLLSGRMENRETPSVNAPHHVFCGMGSCYGCLATINGVGSVRTCITQIGADMQIDTTGTGRQRD